MKYNGQERKGQECYRIAGRSLNNRQREKVPDTFGEVTPGFSWK